MVRMSAGSRVGSFLRDGTLTLRPQGRLDFTLHREFSDCYRRAPADTRDYVLDLAATSDLDSAALGMLLLLRDHAGGEGSRVHLVNASPDVERKLRIARFELLFNLVGGV